VITVYRHADSYKRYEHPLILQAGGAQGTILRFLSLLAVQKSIAITTEYKFVVYSASTKLNSQLKIQHRLRVIASILLRPITC
jgi:hypothetical protein